MHTGKLLFNSFSLENKNLSNYSQNLTCNRQVNKDNTKICLSSFVDPSHTAVTVVEY